MPSPHDNAVAGAFRTFVTSIQYIIAGAAVDPLTAGSVPKLRVHLVEKRDETWFPCTQGGGFRPSTRWAFRADVERPAASGGSAEAEEVIARINDIVDDLEDDRAMGRHAGAWTRGCQQVKRSAFEFDVDAGSSAASCLGLDAG